jgi:hypothetical protein
MEAYKKHYTVKLPWRTKEQAKEKGSKKKEGAGHAGVTYLKLSK